MGRVKCDHIKRLITLSGFHCTSDCLKTDFCFFLQIQTPSKRYLEYGYLQTKPFYREPWFLVALAAASIVIIIMVVAILCVKSKSYKYKGKKNLQKYLHLANKFVSSRLLCEE
jgi:hypothetical protein